MSEPFIVEIWGEPVGIVRAVLGVLADRRRKSR